MKPLSLKKIFSIPTLLGWCVVLNSLSLYAEDVLTATMLQQQWDRANYAISDKKEKTKALETLANQARLAATQQNTDASVQIWAGIILSTYAGEAGISALSLVKEAKSHFETAIELNPDSMQGAAYTSLGSLYYQVPGWPLSFGDDDKAAELLNQGLVRDPEGIDANYFYADYLVRQKKYHEATIHFEKVLKAAPRPGRDLADQGRKEQAKAALEQAHKKIK